MQAWIWFFCGSFFFARLQLRDLFELGAIGQRPILYNILRLWGSQIFSPPPFQFPQLSFCRIFPLNLSLSFTLTFYCFPQFFLAWSFIRFSLLLFFILSCSLLLFPSPSIFFSFSSLYRLFPPKLFLVALFLLDISQICTNMKIQMQTYSHQYFHNLIILQMKIPSVCEYDKTLEFFVLT